MRHYFSKKVRIVLILAVVLAVLLAVASNLLGMSLPDLVVKGIMTPIRGGASALTDQAEQLYSYVFRYEALAAENELLRQELSQMKENNRRADALARENDLLRALLDLKAAHDSYQMVDAYVIGQGGADWSSLLTIDRGSNSGIEVGMCAITAHGQVVGLVTEVGPNYAVVKTVLDSSLEISATISSSGYNGMVQGGYTTGFVGMLRMDYLPTEAVIRNRDEVVTAGSTMYPRDLLLGYVVDAAFDDTGVAKYAILEPATDFGSLKQLFILTSSYAAG
jgi:rod shape-determining protein MreC